MSRFTPSKLLLVCAFIILQHTLCRAQYTYVPPSTQIQDTLSFIKHKKPFFERKGVQIAFVPTLFFAASAATWGERQNIREIRNRYIPTFKNKFDDYLQYTPAVSVFALKLSGVKGRNNLLRSTLSYGASLAIMAILVNGVKYTAKVERPDGSSNNSFPSGHTAMAFTNATFLHKEYGLVNPMYSIAGYGVATFTGLGRGLNNRHWISDVLAGAGIGILSTQLGYFFIDKIFKNEGDNMSILSQFTGCDKPSYLALKLGNATATHNLVKVFEDGSKSKLGFEAGLEGAYYFTKTWGLGGSASFVSFPISASDDLLADAEEADESFANAKMITQSIGAMNFTVGPQFAYSFNPKLLMQVKLNGGLSVGSKGKISLKLNEYVDGENELEIASYKPSNTFIISTGASLTYKIKEGLGLTLYGDYNYLNPTFTYSFNTDVIEIDGDDSPEGKMKNRMDFLGIGLRLSAFF